MENTEKGDNAKFLDIIARNSIGVVSTVQADSTGKIISPESSSVMAIAEDDFSLYFLIKTNSRKYENILKNPKISFTFTDLCTFETIQIEGTAHIQWDIDTEMKYIEKLQQKIWKMGRMTLPTQKIQEGKFIVIKCVPHWVRYGGFQKKNNFNVFTQILG